MIPTTVYGNPLTRMTRPTPEVVADHDDGGAADAILLPPDAAADGGAHAEHGKQIGGRQRRGNTLGCLHSGDADGELHVRAHSGEGRRPRAPIDESIVRCSHRTAGAELRCAPFVHVDEAVRIGEGQRLERHRVDEAEYGCIRADAERQHRQRDSGEEPRLRETAEGEANVPGNGVHGSPQGQSIRSDRCVAALIRDQLLEEVSLKV